ncbi:MAG TPA: BlaI/MecI/CopY family transcriptional regulator [Thermoanaerobaculia bacterium]|jgi:predicted transcriptional regulator|nr:BlaI/MecI/CopY family transcriptional regulator [Thermoanaerobaculia bacterium]
MSGKTIGDQELTLLKHVAEVGPVSVGQVAEGFGAPRGLARSTVLTMMERLRQKGHLEREQVGGVFQYSAASSLGELLRGAVHSFVEKTLAGSVSPFVSYLTERSEVSDDELAELEQLVDRLKSRRREP